MAVAGTAQTSLPRAAPASGGPLPGQGFTSPGRLARVSQARAAVAMAAMLAAGGFQLLLAAMGGFTALPHGAALAGQALFGAVGLGGAVALGRQQRRLNRLYQALAARTEEDEATGLANRSGLRRALQLELRRAGRERKPLGLAAIEIDRFSEIAPGQRLACARRLAQLMRETGRRAGDLGAYLDEGRFMLLLPNTDLRNTTMLAEHLCSMVQIMAMPLDGGGSVSVSVGTTGEVPANATTSDDIWRAANAALAAARRRGGNAVVAAGDMPAVQAG